MAKSKSTSVRVWESWFAANPLFRGGRIGSLPVEWRQWLREVPAVVLNSDGELTDARFPDAWIVRTVDRSPAGQTDDAAQ
jgi:hypothetical protein